MGQPPNRPDDLLDEDERRRLRAEARYLLLATSEARPPPPPKSALESVLGYLSNGFVLLIVGSIITSILVPSFQKKAEFRKEQVALMQECLSNFFVYSNSLWLELHTLVPLTQKAEIDEQTYLRHLGQIAPIRQQRSDAIARARALAAVFQIDTGSAQDTALTATLDEFTAHLDGAARTIERWLNGLYCTPFVRDSSPCADYDFTFDAHREYLALEKLVADVSNREASIVAAKIANRINQQ